MPEGLAIVRQDGFGNRTFFRLLDGPVFRIGRHLLVPLALESERGGAAPEVCSQTPPQAGEVQTVQNDIPG